MAGMPSESEFFMLLSIVILLPVIPAAILYSILPSTGKVTGKLHGTVIKLGGAFAGYFALVIVIISELPQMYAVVNPPPSQLAQIWDVEGQMVDDHGKSIEPLTVSDIAFQPNTLTLNKDGLFKATFVTQLTQTAAGAEFPKLLLSHQGYIDREIDLGPSAPNSESGMQYVRDEKNHVIKLKPIVLMQDMPYSAGGTPPLPVDPHQYATATGNGPGGSIQ
jgi:hypothetical protein